MNTRFATILSLAALCACGTPEAPTAQSFTVDTPSVDVPEVAPEADSDVVAFLEASDVVGPEGTDSPDSVDATPETGSLAASEPAEPTVPVHTFALRRGESVHHFARWSEQPIEQIADLSDLELDGTYEVGTEVKLALTQEERSRLEARRDAHHQTRAQAYLDSRGPHATDFYTVKTGDSAWTIARNADAVPVWLIESLNPSTDLERLRPGQELMVPVFQDITASLDEEE